MSPKICLRPDLDFRLISHGEGFADFVGESSESDRKFIRNVLINHTKYLFPKASFQTDSSKSHSDWFAL